MSGRKSAQQLPLLSTDWVILSAAWLAYILETYPDGPVAEPDIMLLIYEIILILENNSDTMRII